MKRSVSSLAVGIVVMFLLGSMAFAEMRTWTDKRGRTLEGSLVRIDGDEAVILLKSGSEVKVDRAILSAKDNEYLAEYGGAASAVVVDGKVGIPEQSMSLDKSTFEKRDEPFVFPDTELAFNVLETPHFLVMTDGRLNPRDVAETAERMWQGMSFQHPGFAEKWGDQRRAIFVIEEDETHKNVGEFYVDYLHSINQDLEAARFATTWPESGGSQIMLSEEVAEKDGLFRRARVFRVRKGNESSYKKVFTPFVTHCLASDMLGTQAGGTSSFGSKGYFALSIGHAYYKEIQLAEKSETSILSAQYDSDELSKARGFNDGTSWAKELKKLVRKDDVIPSIPGLYDLQAANLSPENLVLAYSFSYYMQSTPARLASYVKLVERINTSRQVPEPVELAKIFGFETVEELETDWKDFIGSTKFK